MEIYYDIVQGSEDWHKIRYGKIGGTSASGLFAKGEKKDNLLEEILAAKSEDYWPDMDSYISSDMQRGNELQPVALEKAGEYLGLKFIEVGWLQCEENNLVGISPDGMTESFKDMIEIKCPAAKRHLQTIKANEIPFDNTHQCVHYFTVNPFLERLHFCSFRPENKFKSLFIKTITKTSTVNVGTKANPINKMVLEVVAESKLNAEKLRKQVESELEKLSF